MMDKYKQLKSVGHESENSMGIWRKRNDEVLLSKKNSKKRENFQERMSAKHLKHKIYDIESMVMLFELELNK